MEFIVLIFVLTNVLTIVLTFVLGLRFFPIATDQLEPTNCEEKFPRFDFNVVRRFFGNNHNVAIHEFSPDVCKVPLENKQNELRKNINNFMKLYGGDKCPKELRVVILGILLPLAKCLAGRHSRPNSENALKCIKECVLIMLDFNRKPICKFKNIVSFLEKLIHRCLLYFLRLF
jgi:hypothetical protein